MSYDYNKAGAQRILDVIPAGTPVILQTYIRPGEFGEDLLMSRSKTSEAVGFNLEFTVTEGEYAKRKVFAFFVLQGPTEGHVEAADISRRTLRAILESARGIKPTDLSEAAQQVRLNTKDSDFQGMRFM